MTETTTTLKQRVLHELMHYWFIVCYLAIFFGVFTSYRRLLLAHYGVSYADYGISLIRALVLGKVILIADALRLARGLEDKPLAVPTVYKTFLFTICMAVFDTAESFVRGLMDGLTTMGAVTEVVGLFHYEWLSRALVIFFAFIPFFAVRELRRVLGKGVIDVFWRRRSSAEFGGGSPLTASTK